MALRTLSGAITARVIYCIWQRYKIKASSRTQFAIDWSIIPYFVSFIPDSCMRRHQLHRDFQYAVAFLLPWTADVHCRRVAF